MELVAHTLSHKTASLAAVEKLLEPSSRSQIHSWAAAREDLLEVVTLTTCLRVEIYAVVEDPALSAERFQEMVCLLSGLSPAGARAATLTGGDAARHLLRVTAGMESVLWGETSATHQVKQAYREAVDRSLCGPWLHRLFHAAFRTAKRLRSEAGVASPRGSLARLAVDRIVENGKPSRLLVLGAGRAGRAVLREARRIGVPHVDLYGTRRAEARELAEAHGARALAESDLAGALETADAVIAASGRGRILSAADLARAGGDGSRRLKVIDLGLPRNVDPAATRLPWIDLEDLAHLGRLVREEESHPKLASRRNGTPAWETVLDEGVSSYEIWRESRRRPARGETATRRGDGPAARSLAGEVFLVGAGPGDPDLLTLAAARLLETADIVFHDALIPGAILNLIPAGIRRVPVGRRKGHVVCRQENVHRGMIAWARRGARVVRLKGGDPSVFGRAGEESDALRAAGVEVRVVPGITAASAAAAAMSIPLTQRGVSSSCVFVSGHAVPEDGTAADPLEEIRRLARSAGTMAIYMGATNIGPIARALLDAGRSPLEPACVVEKASLPDQRLHLLTVGELAALREGFATPAVVLVGPTVGSAGGTRVRGDDTVHMDAPPRDVVRMRETIFAVTAD